MSLKEIIFFAWWFYEKLNVIYIYMIVSKWFFLTFSYFFLLFFSSCIFSILWVYLYSFLFESGWFDIVVVVVVFELFFSDVFRIFFEYIKRNLIQIMWNVTIRFIAYLTMSRKLEVRHHWCGDTEQSVYFTVKGRNQVSLDSAQPPRGPR